MKPERIGKIMRVAPKASIDALASEQELEMKVIPPIENSIDDIVASGAKGAIDAGIPAADDDLVENPKLKRFRAKQLNQVEYTVDVAFMENVIRVLIDNHGITITPKDIRDILAPFGDAVVKTQMIPVESRGVEDLNCCGCSKKQQQEAVEVVKSIALNGLSLVKHIPDLLGFLGKIGISI
jgi:hypothetical protein